MKKLLLLTLALVASISLFAQQKSIGGVATSGGMSEGHEAGSLLSVTPAASLVLADAVSVHRRLVLSLSDSLGVTANLSSSLLLPLSDSLHLADSLIVDYIANYRPTAFDDIGQDQDGNPSPCTNDGNAIDGNPATATTCNAGRSQDLQDFSNKEIIYFGFPQKRGSPSTINLNVTSSASLNSDCTTFHISMEYSLNGGVAWVIVPGQVGVYSQNTAAIPLSPTQDFTQVSVRGLASCVRSNGGTGIAILNINEIWILAE